MPGLFRRKAADHAPADVADAPLPADAPAPVDIAPVDIATDASIVPENIEDMTKAQMVEAIVAAGAQDQAAAVALIEALLDAELQVPMGVDADGNAAMGAVMTEVDGVVYVAVFTSIDAAAHVRDMTSEFATMTGKHVIGTLRPDMGLLVETGAGKFGLIPPMLASIRETIQSREVSGELETLANRVRSGAAHVDDLVALLLTSKVVVPTPDEPKGGGGFTPVVTMVGGSPRLVVAASFDAAARSRGVAEFAMSVDGAYIFSVVKDGVGIQLNTMAGSVDLPPELCASVVKKHSLAAMR